MTDKEERQHVIEILQKEKKTALHDNRWAFDYAISSIKTDLKYDLLYEDNQIADADKPITEDNSCLATIHTEGLDEEIRCVMCSNRMKSDRGCDGSCVVDNTMYKKVMDAIERRIQPTTRNDKVDCEHTDCNNCVNHKYCDYESNKSEIPTGSTTKNNLAVDCILREDALMCLTGEFENRKYEPSELIKMFASRIKALSPVTPQPKIGHWIEHEHNGKSYIECSECLCWFLSEHLIRNSHCPNCGSRNVAENEVKND